MRLFLHRMKIVQSITDWFRKKSRNQRLSKSSEPLREFVYLDEVSVSSLLASRKGGIPTEFTESRTASLNSETGGSINVGFGGLGSSLDTRSQSSRSVSSQVLRKAVIQTSFNELYDIEKNHLSLRSLASSDQPNTDSYSDFQRLIDDPRKKRWIVDIDNLSRGDLLEAKVELEADPLFKMTTMIATLHELIGDGDDVFGSVPAGQVREAYRVGQILERLMTGLVPLRGRIVDYGAIQIRGKEFLAHRSLKDQLGTESLGGFNPVYITGVAEQSLFWKDIRQVLFSGAQYSVFCRLATEGLMEEWQPIKVADLFQGVVSEFREATRNLGEIARQTMEGSSDSITTPQQQDGLLGTEVIKEYISLLAEYHQTPLRSDFMEDRLVGVIPEWNWLQSISDHRPIFDQVTKLVEAELGVETPGDIRQSLRRRSLDGAVPDLTKTALISGSITDQASAGHSERFIDTEIVAIYW